MTMVAEMTEPDPDLDPLGFPLQGQRLIEASAGTGKTFTLALLYTRLVLGHGSKDTAFARALTPPEILVVTFTDAATKELRGRIRARLVEAADWFAAEATATPPDPLLARLREDYLPEDWPRCTGLLRQAADWMDEAVIATIHGFCQRMLQEHAFATRGLFERELLTDQSELLLEVVRDYWRVQFYPLSADRAACIHALVTSPEALLGKLSERLKAADAPISHCGQPVPVADLGSALDAACEQRRKALGAAALEDRARGCWRDDRAAIEALLWNLRPHLNGTQHDSANEAKFSALLAQLNDWSQGGAAPSKLVNFAQDRFAFKKTAKVQQAPVHAAFQALADWQSAVRDAEQDALALAPPLEARLLAHAADWLARELRRRLGARAQLGFDDLLRDLDAALNPAAPPEQARAEALAESLRRQFPVALIDEFQDTDPLQYRIFSRIYRDPPAPSGDAHPPTALVLIGDPKQAIYGFRGADIHAYLAARAAASGRRYTLKTNFRATDDMVAACNHLFEHAERHPRGAFGFRDTSAPEDNPIPYVRVKAKGRAEHLVLDGQPARALTLWWHGGADGKPVGMTEYRRVMAEVAAAQIVRWLIQAAAGQAGFREGARWQPLRARDIAILVRSGTEAQAMRTALAARRVHSVYLSDRDSVFASAEAGDVLHWLKAFAAPGDDALVRAALGTNTLRVSLADLAGWREDELAWEEQLARFRDYRQTWQRRGVLAALRRLMHAHELPTRLLARPEGERQLTNLLHLAEWLQRAAAALDGEQALIRHLSEHLGQGESDDESILRLESDAELVQVVTIHKAKGLEYPLVLLPFICSWREVTGKVGAVLYRPDADPGGARRFVEVAGKRVFPEAWRQADGARLTEDMRLLYVAITRARHGLWLGVAPLRSGQAKSPQLDKGAFGYLLNGHQPFADCAAVGQRLLQLAQGCAAMAVVNAPSADARVLPRGQDETLEPARAPGHRAFLPWGMSSYSALSRGMMHLPDDSAPAADAALAEPLALAESAGEETALEEATLELSAPAEATLDATGEASGESSSGSLSLHAFPRGSGAGTFLHGLLEWAGRVELAARGAGQGLSGFAAAASIAPLRRNFLARRCLTHGLQAWTEPLTDWLGAFLNQTWHLHGLGAGGDEALTLASLGPERVQVEMEFWIPTRAVDIRRLDDLVCRHCMPGASRPRLRAGQLDGMLKGFIDLVFEHQGRFFVLDWKSNWLGPDDAAYTLEAMRAAILHHRYDLQYLLYLLALHRLLGTRLPDYDPDQHLGGAVYVFLRGASAASQGLFVDCPARALIEALDDLFAGECRP